MEFCELDTEEGDGGGEAIEFTNSDEQLPFSVLWALVKLWSRVSVGSTKVNEVSVSPSDFYTFTFILFFKKFLFYN